MQTLLQSSWRMKELWKSADISRSYRKNKKVRVFWDRVYMCRSWWQLTGIEGRGHRSRLGQVDGNAVGATSSEGNSRVWESDHVEWNFNYTPLETLRTTLHITTRQPSYFRLVVLTNGVSLVELSELLVVTDILRKEYSWNSGKLWRWSAKLCSTTSDRRHPPSRPVLRRLLKDSFHSTCMIILVSFKCIVT